MKRHSKACPGFMILLNIQLQPMLRLLAVFLIILCSTVFSIGQNNSHAATKSWRDSMSSVILGQVAAVKSAADIPADRVTRSGGKTEFWKINHQRNRQDSLSCIEVWSYNSPHLHTETYVEQNGVLIYAFESMVFMPIGQYRQMQWNCALFFHDKRIFDMRSFGHGKTEDPDWNERDLYDNYLKRKKQMRHFKD